MAYIKKLKNNELVGGTDNNDVYPVTSTKAVYGPDNVPQEDVNNNHSGRIAVLEKDIPLALGEHNYLKMRIDDFQKQLNSLAIGSAVPISSIFGNSETVCISQKALTAAFQKVWSKLEEITGETFNGVTISISPDYYVGEDGCTVSLSVDNTYGIGTFDYVKLIINGTPVDEVTGVDTYSFSTTINETSTIRCEASLLGQEYYLQKTITQCPSFWLGAGNSYSSIMVDSKLIPMSEDSYDITAQNQYIYIVIAETIANRFQKAEMGGVEILFDESTQTVNNKTYKVLKSEATYNDTVNIDIHIRN